MHWMGLRVGKTFLANKTWASRYGPSHVHFLSLTLAQTWLEAMRVRPLLLLAASSQSPSCLIVKALDGSKSRQNVLGQLTQYQKLITTSIFTLPSPLTTYLRRYHRTLSNPGPREANPLSNHLCYRDIGISIKLFFVNICVHFLGVILITDAKTVLRWVNF